MNKGQWGVEKNEWCGIDEKVCNPTPAKDECWSLPGKLNNKSNKFKMIKYKKYKLIYFIVYYL